MRFFPCEKFTIQATSTKEEIINTVRLNTNPGRLFPFFRSCHNMLFNGTVGKDRFEIASAIVHGNSFKPIIYGQVTQNENGCCINITMRLYEATMAFLIIWLSLCGMSIVFVMSTLRDSAFTFGHIIPLILFVFALVITHIGFKSEAKKSKKQLLEMFGVKQDEIR